MTSGDRTERKLARRKKKCCLGLFEPIADVKVSILQVKGTRFAGMKPVPLPTYYYLYKGTAQGSPKEGEKKMQKKDANVHQVGRS